MILTIRAETERAENPLCELVALLDELAERLGEQLDAGALLVPAAETIETDTGYITVSIELEPGTIAVQEGAPVYADEI